MFDCYIAQVHQYHRLRIAFSKFSHRHSELIVEYGVGLKALLQQGLFELVFYGDVLFLIRLSLNTPISTKVVSFSRLLKCLRSLYGKPCGPISESVLGPRCLLLYLIRQLC